MDDLAKGRDAARDAEPDRDAVLDAAPANASPAVVAFHDRGLSELMYREYAVRALRGRSCAPAIETLPETAPPGAANGNAPARVDAPNPVLVGLGLIGDGAAMH